MNLFFWELLPRSRPSQPSYTPSSITSHAALTISFHLTRLGKGHDLTLLKSAHYQRAKRGQICKGVQIYVTNECTFDIWAEPRWRHLTRKRTQSMNSLCYGTNILYLFYFLSYFEARIVVIAIVILVIFWALSWKQSCRKICFFFYRWLSE